MTTEVQNAYFKPILTSEAPRKPTLKLRRAENDQMKNAVKVNKYQQGRNTSQSKVTYFAKVQKANVER
jgi:hypothetical protein